MTVSLRTVPLLPALLLMLAGAWSPPTSVVQTAPDTSRTTQIPPTANESLDATEQANDSLHATRDEPRASTIEQTGETAQSMGLRAFWAVVALILTYLVARGVERVLEPLAEQSRRPLFFKQLLPLLHILLWGLAIYFVLRIIFSVAAEELLAIAVVVGVAVGLAAQDVLKNMLGGLVIAFAPPFQVGDRISVANTYGTVTAIGLRSTHITTPDDTLVSVPNAQVVNEQVVNVNAGAPHRQVITHLYLPGGVDATKAKEIAHAAAASSTYVYLKKPIVVHVRDAFKEAFLTHLKVKAYVFDARYEALLTSDITERARRAFREQGLLSPTFELEAHEDVSPLPHAEENSQSLSD